MQVGVGTDPWSWEQILCGGHDDSRPTVGRIITTAATALDSKAALGLPIPANTMAKYTTICTGAGKELDLSSWDWILCGGHGNSRPPVCPINTNASIETKSVAIFLAMVAVVTDIL